MVPSSFVFLDEFPLTPNGKVDRKMLPAPESSGLTPRPFYEAPRTDLEMVVAGIWEEVLRAERVGVHDNFFALGGHSLLATGILLRVRDRYGIDLPLRTIFEAPTVHDLAERIGTQLWAARAATGDGGQLEECEEIEL
jgi:hypothetical protein